ncbi:hypothetical protein B296_00026557 [Ensete ventricosum]|uniref:Uncharacterized protein n=1 Tax=Ensete ventricosum TaxID=4639 RepID=A0A426ZRQ9_ENSVE|nr:hypothetical protein B296_00026557 [Ensete ventricosum]
MRRRPRPHPRNQATAMAKSGMAVKATDCGEMRGDDEGLRGRRRRRRRRRRGAHSPVVLVLDVPAAGVALVPVHGVLPIRPLRRKHEGVVVHRGVAGGRQLGDEPPPCAKAVFFKLSSTYKLSSREFKK